MASRIRAGCNEKGGKTSSGSEQRDCGAEAEEGSQRGS